MMFRRFRSAAPWRRFMIGCMAAALALGTAGVARADTISSISDTTGAFTNGQTLGQKITTPGGGTWNNVAINFYYFSDSSAFASGDLYLLSAEYLGTPASLSNLTTGFIAMATASGNAWTFASDVTLAADTTYYFYMTSNASANTVVMTSTMTSGAQGYGSALGTGNFFARPFEVLYTLSGDVVAVPEPGSLPLLAAGLGALLVARRLGSGTRRQTGRI